MFKSIPLSSLEKSELNERLEDDDEESQTFKELVSSIETLGDVNDALLVRPMDGGGYEVIKGSRRLRAAKKANGVNEIRCEVSKISDTEALQRTITDNIDSFKKEIEPHERARSLYELWQNVGETQRPSARELGNLLGVSSSTVDRWLEPLDDTWEDTIIDPLSEKQHLSHDGTKILNLSNTKLRSCRRATQSDEEALELAKTAVEENLTVKQLSDIRGYTQNGIAVEKAVLVVTGELSKEELETEEVEDTQEETETSSFSEEPTTQTEDTQETSVAELSSSGESWTDTIEEVENEEPEPEEEDEDQREDEGEPPADHSDLNRPPLVSEEDMKLAEETRGWADIEADIEATKGEGETIEINFEVSGIMAEAVEDATSDYFQDPNRLAREALRKYLREGCWLE